MQVATVGMNYEVAEGREAAFEARLARIVQEMQLMPEHLNTMLYRQVTDDRRYLVVSVWRCREGFDAFVASEAFRVFMAWSTEHALIGQQHEIYGDPTPLFDAPPVAHA